MSDIGTLAATADKAQAALSAAKDEQAALSAAAAAEAHEREVSWAWATILAYPQRQAAESEKVTAALAAFSAAVVEDFSAASGLYLDVVRRSAVANAAGADLAKARHILRTAGLLPRIDRAGRDPVGDAAPWPLSHGMARLPSFLDMVTAELDRQRMAASRAVSAEEPPTFGGTITEAMRTDALRAEWTMAQEYESLLALKVQWPARFAKLSPDEQADTLAYEATRQAAGYDEPLPRIAEARLREAEPAFAPDAVARFRLYSDDHAPSSR